MGGIKRRWNIFFAWTIGIMDQLVQMCTKWSSGPNGPLYHVVHMCTKWSFGPNGPMHHVVHMSTKWFSAPNGPMLHVVHLCTKLSSGPNGPMYHVVHHWPYTIFFPSGESWSSQVSPNGYGYSVAHLVCPWQSKQNHQKLLILIFLDFCRFLQFLAILFWSPWANQINYRKSITI